MASGNFHVLIGGGTGFVGAALRSLLTAKGYNVTIVSRMPGPKRVTWLDISSSGLPTGVNAVINLAGQNILDPMQRWTPGFKQNVWNSRVNTTLTLAKAIEQADVKPSAFITISGVGIYKPSDIKEYDESSDVSESFDFLSKLALEWEAASRLPPQVNTRVTNIRSGVVLGRTGGMIKQMYFPFFFGLGGPIGSGNQFLPWIHVKDLCNLFIFAMDNQNVSGPVNGVSPQIITNSEFTKAFASAMHRPAFIPVPEFALNLMFSEERAKIMTQGQKVKPTKAVDLGFKFEYPTIDLASKECSKLFYSTANPI